MDEMVSLGLSVDYFESCEVPYSSTKMKVDISCSKDSTSKEYLALFEEICYAKYTVQNRDPNQTYHASITCNIDSPVTRFLESFCYFTGTTFSCSVNEVGVPTIEDLTLGDLCRQKIFDIISGIVIEDPYCAQKRHH